MRNLLETRRVHVAHRFASAIALAIAVMANGAGAVTLSPHGIGQALIYPYYTVNKDQDTLISVTNASDVGKAIQVRFREGMNGRDALSFVLLLGAHDTWTASMAATGDDLTLVNTSDTSCTLPSFPTGGTNLRSAGFDGTGELPADGGPQTSLRTREGFLELIAGGDVLAGSPTDQAMARPVGGGKPACPADDHAFVPDLQASMSGGIFGSASIVDVASGTFFAYNADALAGLSDDVMFADGAPYPGPQLSDASSNEATDGGARAYLTTTNGRNFAVDYSRGIDAVSAVFMADAIYNEYVVSPSLGAKSDWVVAFPTKQYYVDGLYGAVPKAPFDTAFSAGVANIAIGGTFFDREQQSVDFGDGCGPVCPPASLPFEVNVIGMGDSNESYVSPVLGSLLDAVLVPPLETSGNGVIRFVQPSYTRTLSGGIDTRNNQEISLHGLPVTGFMVYNIVNANASPGVLANYSGAFPHRRTVDCAGNTPECVAF